VFGHGWSDASVRARRTLAYMTEDGSLRASDADREAVAELLREAHAEGRLDYAELDERLTQTYAARTHGDLERLTMDLPRPDQQAMERAPAPQRPPARSAPTASVPARKDTHPVLRGAWYAYFVAVGINVVIWAIVSLTNQEWTYFWPIWVAGPWGIVLLASTLIGRDQKGRGGRG
jgi:Domain of unknown function (DUF1707)